MDLPRILPSRAWTTLNNKAHFMLETFFKPALINVDLESSDKDELFEEMVELFARGGCELDRAEALDALIAREEKMTTGIVPSVAIPHASCPSVKNGFGAIGISRKGIEYGSLDGKPVHVVFMLLFGSDGTALHLKVMQQLALILKNPEAASRLAEKKTAQDLYEELCALEEALA